MTVEELLENFDPEDQNEKAYEVTVNGEEVDSIEWDHENKKCKIVYYEE